MILDTNAVSGLVVRNANLVALIRHAPRLCVTCISLGEYQFGILGSSKKKELEHWLDQFLQRVEVLFLNRETMSYYASIRHQLKKTGNPIPANDVWIAALAKQHRMSLVSLDTHFDHLEGVQRLAWQ